MHPIGCTPKVTGKASSKSTLLTLTLPLLLQSCSDGSDRQVAAVQLMAGAASRSVLPTVSGGRAYLGEAPGWPSGAAVDPDNPGVFIPAWDQGRVDVGNGRSDSAWVHDDIRTTALALQFGEHRAILVMADTYSYSPTDITVMVERIRGRLPDDWQEVIEAAPDDDAPF